MYYLLPIGRDIDLRVFQGNKLHRSTDDDVSASDDTIKDENIIVGDEYININIPSNAQPQQPPTNADIDRVDNYAKQHDIKYWSNNSNAQNT